ncbi:hypothetical protein C8J57DRAFT_1194459 [Mycena rebaudengoi]|nr:hypothetical protein C8J57DRAFT_1194459 [Mycena rebaudengoi]
MKRGFLNSSKAKARPLGPSLTAPKPPELELQAPMRFPIGKFDVALPEGYETTKTEFVERDAHSGSLPNSMTCTRVPIEPVPGESSFSECLFYPGSKDVLMNLPGFPQPVKCPTETSVRMDSASGMGMGLFSTRALKMGDLILSERPPFVAAQGIPVLCPEGFTREQYVQLVLNQTEQVYQISVNRMRPEDRTALMALANSHKQDGSGPITGIVRTNGLALNGLRPGVSGGTEEYSAVCKDISRLNHSCSPNTATRFDMLSFSYQLFAVRDIPAGEELTYQYVGDVVVPTAERHKSLKPYDFVCTCAACTDAPASDVRRATIKAFAADAQALRMRTDPDAFLETCRAQLALIEREGLEHTPSYFDLITLLSETHRAKGDVEGANEWAAKVDKLFWDEEHPINAKNLPASAADSRWNTPAKIFQELAGLGGFTMVPGGAGMILHPQTKKSA